MMAGHRAIMDLSREEWLRALGLDEADIPEAVIMEGSWWREQRTAWRLEYLDEVRELAFPDMFLGRWRGRPVAYSCVYGAPRAVELAHLFGVLGTRRMAMIGTCGGLDPELEPGDAVVPSAAVPREGVARLYGAGELVRADPQLVTRARRRLEEDGIRVRDRLHLTWFSIFAQSGEMVGRWREEGFGSVDMETATLYAVAAHFGFAAVALLAVWDRLDEDKSFLDPLSPRRRRALDKANAAVYETALEVTLA